MKKWWQKTFKGPIDVTPSAAAAAAASFSSGPDGAAASGAAAMDAATAGTSTAAVAAQASSAWGAGGAWSAAADEDEGPLQLLESEEIEAELARFASERHARGSDLGPAPLWPVLEAMLAEQWAARSLSHSESADSAEAARRPARSELLSMLVARVRSNIRNRVALGAMELTAELIAQHRDLITRPAPHATGSVAAQAHAAESAASLSEEDRESLAIQGEILHLFRLLAPFTPSTHALHCFFNLFEKGPQWNGALAHTLQQLAAATSNTTIPFVLFEPLPTVLSPSSPSSQLLDEAALQTQGSLLLVPSMLNARWSSAHSYTSSSWVRWDFKGKRRLKWTQPLAAQPTQEAPSLPEDYPSMRRSATSSDSQLPSRPGDPLSSYAHPPFYLLLLESDDAKSLLSLSFHPTTGTFVLRTNRDKPSVSFTPVRPFEPGVWHHVLLSHSKALIGASSATLFVDGVALPVQKASFPSKPAAAANVSVRVGLMGNIMRAKLLAEQHSQGSLQTNVGPPLPAAPAAAMLRWRVASTAFLDEATHESTARSLFDLGPRLAGVAAGATLVAAKCTTVDVSAAAGLYAASNALNEALDDVTSGGGSSAHGHRPQTTRASSTAGLASGASAAPFLDPEDNRALLPGSSSVRLSAAENFSLQPTSVFPADKLVFFFHARNSVDKENHDFALLQSQAQAQESMQQQHTATGGAAAAAGSSSVHHRRTSSTSSLMSGGTASTLINGGLLGSCADALLRGGAHLVKPQCFSDQLRSIGGVSRILSLLSRLCTSLDTGVVDHAPQALRDLLQLLASCLRRNPKNLREMAAMDGYTILAHVIKRMGESASAVLQAAAPRQRAGQRTCTLAVAPSPSPVAAASTAAAPGSSSSAALHAQLAAVLADTSLLDFVFSLVGLSAKCSQGSIVGASPPESGAASSSSSSSSSALKSLLLNFPVWSCFDLSVQRYLFEGMVNAIATNAARDANMKALRDAGVIPWLLTLVADQKVSGEIVNHAVSLLREFLMEDALYEEVGLVANFALTACQMHAQMEIQNQIAVAAAQQQQQAPAAGASTAAAASDANPSAAPAPAPAVAAGARHNPSVRRFTIGSSASKSEYSGLSMHDVTSFGIAPGYLASTATGVGAPASAAAAATATATATAVENAFDRELNSYRLGSFLSACTRRTLIELLLDVLSKVQSSPKHLDNLVRAMDFQWIFSALYTLDQAVHYRMKRIRMQRAAAAKDKEKEREKEASGQAQPQAQGKQSPPTSPLAEDDEEVVCDRACAVLVLKLLLTLLSHAALHKRFQSAHGFTALGQLLLPYAHMSEVYGVVLCMMLGKGMYDIPAIPSSSTGMPRASSAGQGSGGHEEWWAQLMPPRTEATMSPPRSSSSSRLSMSNNSVPAPVVAPAPVPIAIPEALPLLMTLLEESLQLVADEHRSRVAAALIQHAAAQASPAITITPETSSSKADGIAPGLLAAANSSAAGIAGVATHPRRPSFNPGGGLSSGAGVGGVAATASGLLTHARNPSISLSPLLTVPGATGMSKSASRDDTTLAGASSVDDHEQAAHRRAHSSSPAQVVRSMPFVNLSLSRSYWLGHTKQQGHSRHASRPSSPVVAGLGSRPRAVGFASELLRVIPDTTMLQNILAFLQRLLSSSDEFRALANKEPFLRSLVLALYASAPLQPDFGSATTKLHLPASTTSCIVDPDSFRALPPTPLQLDPTDSSLVSQLIITPVFSSHYHHSHQRPTHRHGQQASSLSSSPWNSGSQTSMLSGGAAFTRQSSGSVGAVPRAVPPLPPRRKSRPPTPAAPADDAHISVPAAGPPTPMTAVTMSTEEWNAVRGGDPKDITAAAPATATAASSTSQPPSPGVAHTSFASMLSAGGAASKIDAPAAAAPLSFDVFHHPLSVSLFHLLRRIALNAFLANAKFPAFLEEVLELTPNHDLTPLQHYKPEKQPGDKSTAAAAAAAAAAPLSMSTLSPETLHREVSQSMHNLNSLRHRFQNILLCSLVYRLAHTLAPGALLASTRMMQNLVGLCKTSLVPRMQQGVFGAGATLVLQFVSGLLQAPECQAIMEIECGGCLLSKDKEVTISSSSGSGGSTVSPALAGASGALSRRGGSLTVSAPAPTHQSFNVSSFNFSVPLTKPLLDTCGAIVNWLMQFNEAQAGAVLSLVTGPAATHAPVSSVSLHALHELYRLNVFVHQHRRMLLGECQQDKVFLASICSQLFLLIAAAPPSKDLEAAAASVDVAEATLAQLLQLLSVSSIRLWSCILRTKLGYMAEMLRLDHQHSVHAATGNVIHDLSAPLDRALAASVAQLGLSSGPGSMLAGTPNPLSPPRSPNTLLDLLDGGFDQLLDVSDQGTSDDFAVVGAESSAGSAASAGASSSGSEDFSEFLAWRASHSPQIGLVFSKSFHRVWLHAQHEWRKSASASAAHAFHSLINELGKHGVAANALTHRLPQLEMTLINKLQLTCSTELQRNLRKQQRERVDQERRDRELYDNAKITWLRTKMLYSTLDYSRMDIGAGEVQLHSAEGPQPVAPPALEREAASQQPSGECMSSPVAPSIASLHSPLSHGFSSTQFHEFPLDSHLVLRQPWALDSIEGPHRMRKRLEAARIQPADAPLFSFPYRSFETDKQESKATAKAIATAPATPIETEAEPQAMLSPAMDAPADESTATASRLLSIDSDNARASPETLERESGDLVLSPLSFEATPDPLEALVPQQAQGRPNITVSISEQSSGVSTPAGEQTLESMRAKWGRTQSSIVAHSAVAASAASDALPPRLTRHRSTRSDAALLFTPLGALSRRTSLVTLAAASPHHSMLGRLAMGPAAGGPLTSSSSARKHVRQIAGASFTPRYKGTGQNWPQATAPAAAASPSPPPPLSVLSPVSSLSLSPLGSPLFPQLSPSSDDGSVDSTTSASSASGIRRGLMAQRSLASVLTPINAAAFPASGEVLLSPMAPALPPADSSRIQPVPIDFAWGDDVAVVTPSTNSGSGTPTAAVDGSEKGSASSSSLSSATAELQAAPEIHTRPSAVAEGEEGEDGDDVPAGSLVEAHEGGGGREDFSSHASSVSDDWSHPLDAQLWWMEEERLSVLLANESIKFHFNCIRIEGLDEIRSILLLCEKAAFIIDNYEISADGDITPVLSDTELDRLEMEQQNHMAMTLGRGGASVSSSTQSDDPSHPATHQPIDHHSQKFLYSDVIELHKRRYLLREAALELFLVNGKNALLVCNVAQRDQVFSAIMQAAPMIKNQLNAISKLLAAGASAVSSVGSSAVASVTGSSSASLLSSSVPSSLSADFAHQVRTLLHPLTKLWQSGCLSNFEYIAAINSMSGRTFNDLTQYPVFPWILADYDSESLDLDDHRAFRDLTKPMGAQDETRAGAFRQRYRDSETMTLPEMDGSGEKAIPRFHYGSHYSSAAAVLYYLIRVEPFTQTAIKFQGGRFDRGDRMFFSLKSSWLSASKLSTSDVRELIPEHFHFAEMYRNGNRLDMGHRQGMNSATGGAPVNDVILPRWAHGSAREFVRVHRQALESEYVSAHLHSWIDLIFGSRATGDAAVHALNCFYYLTYAGAVDIDRIADPVERRATIEQIRSFGQCPVTLFAKPHPPRHLLPEVGALYLRSHLFKPTHSMHFAHAIGALWADSAPATGSLPERVFVLRPGHTLTPHEAAFAHSSPGLSFSFGSSSAPHKKLGKHRGSKAGFVAHGFTDGTLRTGEIQAVPVTVAPVAGSSGSSGSSANPQSPPALLSAPSKHNRVYLNLHDGVVRSCGMPEVDVGIMVTGGSDCNVHVWRRDPASEHSEYTLLAALHGHRQPVTAIAVSKAFSLIASASMDATVILWDLYRLHPVRQLRVLPIGSRIVSVAFNHRTGYVCIASNNPTLITVCDVNGALLSQYPHLDESHPSSPCDSGVLRSPMPQSSQSASTATGALLDNFYRDRLVDSPLAPVSCLHVVDCVGYQMPHSAALFLTGHTNGAIRVWHMVYSTPQAAATPRGFTSPVAPIISLVKKAGSASDLTASSTPKSVSSGGSSGSAPTSPSVSIPHPRSSGLVVTPAGRSMHRYLSTTVEAEDESLHDEEHAALADGVAAPISTRSRSASHNAAASDDADAEVEAGTTNWEAEDEAAAALAADELRREEEMDKLRDDVDAESKHAADAPLRKVKSLPLTPSPDKPPAADRTASSSSAPSTTSPLAVDVSAEEAAPNATGGRSWRLVVASELIGHASAVSAVHVPADRGAVWSGDVSGQVICWSVSEGSSVGVASTVACNCKQSAQHKSSAVPYNCRLCSQCTRWVCSYCRLDHLRREHTGERTTTRSGGASGSAASSSRPTTPKSHLGPEFGVAASL